ncbi:MAG: (2Fe-2S)-binding protein [Nitrospinae bacterium]|nr:(2Fe-2S)-binding protein [Nitrospinota bacterium]
MSTQQQMINNFKKVCICRSVTGGTIMKAIREGSLSFEALRRAIRVGTGNCKAKRCRPKIEAQLEAYKADLEPSDNNGSQTASAKINA